MPRMFFRVVYSVLLSVFLFEAIFLGGRVMFLLALAFPDLQECRKILHQSGGVPAYIITWTFLTTIYFGGPITLCLAVYAYVDNILISRAFSRWYPVISLVVAATAVGFARLIYGPYWVDAGSQIRDLGISDEIMSIAVAVAASAGAFWNFNRLQRYSPIGGQQ